MDFPIQDLMDENACYGKLVALLHPGGLHCPGCQGGEGLNIHRRHREPVLDYWCRSCGRVFNAFTGTVLAGTPKTPVQIMLILRGIAQGVPTAKLARELGLDRPKLLKLRHRLQGLAEQALSQAPLPDHTAEADEMYQNAGEKRHSPSRPRRSAATPRQPSPRPRQLGKRSPARARNRRS